MSRMLSALRILERRPGAVPARTDGVAESLGSADTALPSATATLTELDRDWERFETDLSNVNALAGELLADEPLHAGSPGGAPPSTAAAVWQLPNVEPAPAYRDLAARLAREADATDTAGPVLFAAVRSAALNTFNVVELAAALSAAGREVLIVDLERNAPQGTMQDGLAPQYGLAQILSASATWSDVIRPTSLPGVSFVGPGRPEPLAPAWQHVVGKSWNQLPRGRLVLVSGRVVGRPLATAVAAACRSTYLVVELGEERTAAISSALAALRAARAHVRGAIALDGSALRV